MGSYGWYVSKRWKGPQRVHSAPASMPQQFHRKIRAATAVSQWSHSNSAAIPQQRRKNTFRDPKGIPQESCINDSTVCNPIEIPKTSTAILEESYWSPKATSQQVHKNFTTTPQQWTMSNTNSTPSNLKNTIENDQNKSKVAPKWT